MADVKVGQTWRDDTGYLYKIVAVQDGWVYGRHPNAKAIRTGQIHPSWFDFPGWHLVRDTQKAATVREP